MTSPLATPLTFPISGRTAPNPLLNAAMSESLCSWTTDPLTSGIPTPEYINLYSAWGQGGWGQILTGNIQIHPEHLEAKHNAIIPLSAPFSGPRFEAFQATAAGAKADGALIVGQVSHPGRQVSEDVQKHPISASDIQLVASDMGGKTYAVPRAATQADIDEIVESFAHAAEYLEKAGFDGIQIHGAHGYLVAQFFSPTTNRRTDKYGGSVTNRARLAVEIADAVRARTSASFVVGIKLNSVEFQAGGITGDDAAELCGTLEGAGFDYYELSGGTYEKLLFSHQKESTKKREAFFLEFAETIMAARHAKTGESEDRTQERKSKMPKVYITGGFKTVKGMESAMEVVDGVGLGKAATADPAIAKKLVTGEKAAVPETAVPDDAFMPALVCAIAQIGQIGRGEGVSDLSVPGTWEGVVKAMMEAQAKM